MVKALLLASGAALLLGLAQPAPAAELPPLPNLDPASGPISVGEGWYLRGDVGVGPLASGRWTPPVAASFTPVDPLIVRERIENGFSAAAGVGYRFGPMLRADVTVEARAAATATGVAGAALYRGDFSSRLLLASGYVDLLTWEGLTPFVGASIGIARNDMAGFARVPVASPALSGAPELLSHGSRVNLAWALTAGVAYDLAPGLKLELAYRYLDLGKAETGPGLCGPAFGCATGLRGKEFASHEVRLGVRWLIGTP